jgi:hypothetical protein
MAVCLPEYFEAFSDFVRFMESISMQPVRHVAPPKPPREARSDGRTPLIVIHDFRGGYLPFEREAHRKCDNATAAADLSSLSEEADWSRQYVMRWWDYCTSFVYFSHKFVAIPPAAWISAARSHGVAIYATLLIRDWEAQIMSWATEDPNQCTSEAEQQRSSAVLLQATRTRRLWELACSLTALKKSRVFDGYFVDVQCPLGSANSPSRRSFVGFIAALAEQLDADSTQEDPPGLVLWDSIGADGSKSALHCIQPGENYDVVSSCCSGKRHKSAFVLDYSTFGEILDQRGSEMYQDVTMFQCVDVFGRGVPGELRTGESCAEALRRGYYPCLFAPAWSAERCDGSRRSFLALDDALWKPIVGALTASLVRENVKCV